MSKVQKILQHPCGLTYFYINGRYIPIPTVALEIHSVEWFVEQIEQKHQHLLESEDCANPEYVEEMIDISAEHLED